MIQHVRSGRPDFVVFQSTNVPDDKLLVDKFAEFNLKSDRLPKIGGGGHWAVPELLKNAGAENLEGVMVGLANWPGQASGGSGETLHGPHRRTVVRSRLDFCLRPRHDLQRGTGTGRRRRPRQGDRGDRALDMTDGPALFFPDGRLKYDENGRRVGAKLCVVQWREGRPVPVYPPSIATRDVVWTKA